MNKAVMLPIQPKWVEMIRRLEKIWEFRPYALEVGTKVYIYESLGKKFKCIKDGCDNCRHSYWNGINGSETDGHWTCTIEEKDNKYGGRLGYAYKYEGAGAVVGSFIVEECRELVYFDTSLSGNPTMGYVKEIKEIYNEDEIVNVYDFKKIGYNEQKYAIKLSETKFYDKPIDKSEFTKWNAKCPQSKNGICKLYKFKDVGFKNCNTINCADNKVTHAPQSRIYVVEKEVE